MVHCSIVTCVPRDWLQTNYKGQLPSGLENETADRVVQAPVVQRYHCPLDKYYQTY